MPAVARSRPGWYGLACSLILTALSGAAQAAPDAPATRTPVGTESAPLQAAGPSGTAALPALLAPPGSGGLLVAPTRLVFEGSHRSAEMTLVNTGNRPATYRISLVRMRMGEHGEMREVTVPDSLERFADTLVRYSPRRAVLPPGVPQTVRIQLRIPAVLDSGEYRSHLLFRQVPDAVVAASAQPVPTDKMKLQLTPVFGVAIPLIVRHGHTFSGVTLTDARVRPDAPGSSAPWLEMTLNRTGNQSVYGDIQVTLAQGDLHQLVGEARGLSVYYPNSRRILAIPLRLPLKRHPGDARLLATYTVSGGANPATPATVEVALP